MKYDVREKKRIGISIKFEGGHEEDWIGIDVVEWDDIFVALGREIEVNKKTETDCIARFRTKDVISVIDIFEGD